MGNRHNRDARADIVYYGGNWYKYLGVLPHTIAGNSPMNDRGVWSSCNTNHIKKLHNLKREFCNLTLGVPQLFEDFSISWT